MTHDLLRELYQDAYGASTILSDEEITDAVMGNAYDVPSGLSCMRAANEAKAALARIGASYRG